MMKYAIEITKKAEKELKVLPINMAMRIAKRLLVLEENPRPAQSKKLKDTAFYRLRVGDYRIIYTICDEIHKVNILSIGHRRDVYRQG